mmetsp:Transcript_4576/g.10150  ORF Transcript_4576/g.10150 Transcript_4576/m.10150 type:complete len:165 (-) Transcript_4576:320-814(-)
MTISPARKGLCTDVKGAQVEEVEPEGEIYLGCLNQSKLGMSEITADLVVQIFSSFPHPQYLVRCECVCKRWRLLIASSNLPWDNMLCRYVPVAQLRRNDAQYIPVEKMLEEQKSGNTTKLSSKFLFLECYGIAEREEKKRLSQLHEWAGNLWHEFELGLSSCTS